MSDVARWANTARATVWAKVARDDWTGAESWAAPRLIWCDYSAKAMPMTAASGEAFVSRQVIYTEDPDVKPGDMVLIGVSGLSDPVKAMAEPVRSVTRYGDTFSRAADDYIVAT